MLVWRNGLGRWTCNAIVACSNPTVGYFFIVDFIVEYFVNCTISTICNGLLSPLWLIRCENIDSYIWQEIFGKMDFRHRIFSSTHENVTTYCMCSFDHNFCSKVVTSTYEPILEGWYGEEYWKMVYSPQSMYGISQGAWELVFLCFFWIFTSSRPRK